MQVSILSITSLNAILVSAASEADVCPNDVVLLYRFTRVTEVIRVIRVTRVIRILGLLGLQGYEV